MGWAYPILIPRMPYKTKFVIKRKFRDMNYFYYNMGRRVKGGGMEDLYDLSY